MLRKERDGLPQGHLDVVSEPNARVEANAQTWSSSIDVEDVQAAYCPGLSLSCNA